MHGRQVWLYEFNLAPNPVLGACHCIELPFVFGTVAAFEEAPMLSGLTTERARRITQEVQTAWIQFIRGAPDLWPSAPHRHVFD